MNDYLFSTVTLDGRPITIQAENQDKAWGILCEKYDLKEQDGIFIATIKKPKTK